MHTPTKLTNEGVGVLLAGDVHGAKVYMALLVQLERLGVQQPVEANDRVHRAPDLLDDRLPTGAVADRRREPPLDRRVGEGQPRDNYLNF